MDVVPQNSLLELVGKMTSAAPHFVRCIKPNATKAAMEFDDRLVLEQLRYSGMLETIAIRKTGYPVRSTFQQFANRFV